MTERATLADLDYALPPERIAQAPVRPRDAARLLIVHRSGAGLEECVFRELSDRIGPRDLLVVNDTRVVPARLHGHKDSGGQAELLLLERHPDGSWLALLRASGHPRVGLGLRLDGARAELVEVYEDGPVRVRFDLDDEALFAKLGELPLPPYIRRAPEPSDDVDYQTVFARDPGAVAAPTASLHFTAELAARLRIARVTLHVGPGTFQPIRAASLDAHALHGEHYCVPEATSRAIAHTREAGGRVIAVGTTVVRTLETTGGAAGEGRTELFLKPGDRFHVVDELITNFHLPGSSLLALVMGFAGIERVRSAYAHAVSAGFRFYSYGDAMWVR